MTVLLSQLLGTDAPLPPGGDVAVTGLTADSRKVQPGFVFAALAGVKADGATYINQALASGAVAVISQSAFDDARVIVVANARRLLAVMAGRFQGVQPKTIVAVTGTNGKTSVSVFVRQIWEALGLRAASLGTIGVVGPSGSLSLAHTTPDPVELAALVADLAKDDVQLLAIEASSHGLEQNRLDGLVLSAGAFTNITLDHLDYHKTFDAYFHAKMRLFDELLPRGACAVINGDHDYADQVAAHAQKAGLTIFKVGKEGPDLKLLHLENNGVGQRMVVHCLGQNFTIDLPLMGAFQASNALVAAGLVIATGSEPARVLAALAGLKGAKGRLELVGRTAEGAPVVVDYAHTPDALENVLTALRPATSNKLRVVFGCGGDRDKGKRPLMGAIAARLADEVIVTDDNPRSETAAVIRSEVLKGAAQATEIGDRACAIAFGIKQLGRGDVLLVAGKGHEEGQIIGDKIFPFLDHDAVAAALAGRPYHG